MMYHYENIKQIKAFAIASDKLRSDPRWIRKLKNIKSKEKFVGKILKFKISLACRALPLYYLKNILDVYAKHSLSVAICKDNYTSNN